MLSFFFFFGRSCIATGIRILVLSSQLSVQLNQSAAIRHWEVGRRWAGD